jgi:outer membrane protein TolC
MRDQKTQCTPIRILLPLLATFLCFLAMPGVCATTRAQSGASMPLTLSQAIDLALKQNRSLRLAHLAVHESEDKKEIARSDYLPHIKNESAVLQITDLGGVTIPTGALGDFAATGPVPAQNLTIGQGALTTITSGTGLEQPLTQMFKIREENRAATADINTAKITLNQAEDEVALKVRQLYYGILIAQLKQQAANEQVAASQVADQESAQAVKEGQALDVAELESRASLLDAQQSALTQNLQIHDLMLTLDDLLGLPLNTQLQLDADVSASSLSIPSREECVHISQDNNPDVRAAQQAVLKARAGFAAAKDAYIPDITALARYTYESGVPVLARNFGTFGFSFTYDLFDGGRRSGEIDEARTQRSEAELNLEKVQDEVRVQVESAYDKVEQLQNMVGVAEQLLKVRTEAARLSDQQYEQTEALASARASAHAKLADAKASYLEANLGLSLAQGELDRTIGRVPR